MEDPASAFERKYTGNTTLYWFISKYRQPVFLQKNLKYLFPPTPSTNSKATTPLASPSIARKTFKVDGILPNLVAKNGLSDDQPMMMINIKGIKRKKQNASKTLGKNEEPIETEAHTTHCICELTLYDTTSAINTPLCRSRRSCVVSTPSPTNNLPYADSCTIELRTPFMIESDYFLSARSRRAKSHPDISLAPESFAAHIALQPIMGYPFPPPMFVNEANEFEAFDHLEQAVADWKNLFNPIEGNLTTAILDLPELRPEGWEKTTDPDIVMLSPTGEFGKWNFGFEIQVGWNKQLSLPLNCLINPNPFGGSSPIPRLPTPQSDHSEGSVMFHFTYEAGRYTYRTGWTCPWCEGHRGAFGSMDELEAHLVLTHELFHFRIERSEHAATHIFVEIGHEFVNKRLAEKSADDRVFTHFQPKGKKRNVREYLKCGDSEESYPPIPQPIEKPTDVEHRPIPAIDKKKRRTFKMPTNGEFHRSRSKRRIPQLEEVSETEDEVAEDWLMIKHEEVEKPPPTPPAYSLLMIQTLEDFTDCTAREIRFMKLWDRFVNEDKPQGMKHFPESLVRFAHSHKDVIHTESLRTEFWKFLLNLKQYNRISNMVVKSAIAVIPKDIVKVESPKIQARSPQKSPRTPNGRRGAPVPSGVPKTDEGSYCLCRSVWCNGMVACGNEDCKIEWYHLGCINLWQKPTGRWVCPK